MITAQKFCAELQAALLFFEGGQNELAHEISLKKVGLRKPACRLTEPSEVFVRV